MSGSPPEGGFPPSPPSSAPHRAFPDPGAGPGRAGALPCAHCNALNGIDFERCIRCGVRLDRGVPVGMPPGRAPSANPPLAPIVGTSIAAFRLYATKGLLGFTGVIVALQWWTAVASGGSFFLGAPPLDVIRFGALDPNLRATLDEPFRLLSAVFVHFGIIHAGMNLLALSNLARVAEPAVGSIRFLVAYVVTGLLSFTTTVVVGVVLGDAGGYPTAGASGAVFGVMGLILGFLLRRRDPRWKSFAVQAVLYSVLFGFLFNSVSSSVQINNSAHIGGLVAGVGLGLLYAGPRAARGPSAATKALAGLCVVAVLASLLLAQRSPRWQRGITPDFFTRGTLPSPCVGCSAGPSNEPTAWPARSGSTSPTELS